MVFGRREPKPRKFDPDWVISPGETLRDWMEENGLGRMEHAVAQTCGRMSDEMFQGILDGKTKITPDIAKALEHGTAIPAQLWLNLERAFRDGLAAGKKWIK